MPSVLTQVLAVLFLVLIAAAAIAAIAIALRQRGTQSNTADRAQLASELIELEEELNYAEAFAASDPVATANLARAHAELNLAFATYNKNSAVSGEQLATADANSIRGRLAIVRETLANPTANTGSVATYTPAVIVDTQLAPTIGTGSRIFEVALWVLGIIPGLVLLLKKKQARNYFAALDQRIKSNAAQIDVFLSERADILRRCPGFTPDLDVASAMGGTGRNATNGQIDHAYQVLVERAKAQHYGHIPPDLQAALRADRNVQREITAARTLYNDTVNMWNTDIFIWPSKMMVADEARLTSRPVFVASQLSSAVDLSGVR